MGRPEEDTMKNYQAIYQISDDGVRWQDYVRKRVPEPDDAMVDVRLLAAQSKKRVRVYVEHWNDDEPREPTVYYGEWDQSQLSPAAQKTGVFKPVIY
jgi:hypothetical protein